MSPHFHSSVTQVHDVFVRIFNSGKNWIITKSAMDMVYEILSMMITMLDTKTTIGINTIRMIEIRNIILHRLSYPSRMILRREIITRTTMILIVYSSLEFFFLPPPLICSINLLVNVMEKKMTLLNCCVGKKKKTLSRRSCRPNVIYAYLFV